MWNRVGHLFETHEKEVSILFCLTNRDKQHIIYLTREPMTRVHLAAGKNATKSSALVYQTEGVTFCVCGYL